MKTIHLYIQEKANETIIRITEISQLDIKLVHDISETDEDLLYYIQKLYYCGEIRLTAEDFVDTKFEIVKSK